MECRVFASLQKASLARLRIGVAAGKDHIAVAGVRRREGQRPLLEHFTVLPRGPELASALGAYLKANAGTRAPLSVVLGPAEYQLALIEAPDVLPAELRAAVRWRLRDSIDFHIDDAIVDVFDLPPQSRGGQTRMMYAVAARKSAVAEHGALLGGCAGFDVIDVPELCLRNAASILAGAAQGVALVYLRESTATVVIARGETLYLARHMGLGAGGPAGDGEVDPDVVALELQRSLDYCESHYDQPPVPQVVIAPAGPRAEMLASALAASTGLRVAVFDLAEALECRAAPDATAQESLFLAVAAALREERRSL
jgi:MSHA biogenesis protein MshI